MNIKKQIRITYLVTLEVDNIEQRIDEGTTEARIVMDDLKHGGIDEDCWVKDYEVESVEDIEDKT